MPRARSVVAPLGAVAALLAVTVGASCATEAEGAASTPPRTVPLPASPDLGRPARPARPARLAARSAPPSERADRPARPSPGPPAGATRPAPRPPSAPRRAPRRKPRAAATAQSRAGRSFTAAFTGDTLFHSALWHQAARNAGGTGFDFRPMLADLRPLLRGVDLAVCHLETPIAPESQPLSTAPLYGVPVEVVDALRAAGFDRCSTASNHVADRGTPGIDRTVAALEAAGLDQSGMARTPREARPQLVDRDAGWIVRPVLSPLAARDAPSDRRGALAASLWRTGTVVEPFLAAAPS